MAEPRLRRAQTRPEFETAVDDYVTQGYDILSRGDTTALVRRKTWGTGGTHALVAFLTIWWTFGLGNLLYALLAHSSAEKVLIRLDGVA